MVIPLESAGLNEAEQIVFLCPACSVRLTVPGSLAGVTGPCPSCQVLIQAPYPRDWQAPPPPTYQPPPAVQQPPPAAPLPDYHQTAPQPVSGQQNILIPEPRQLPNRSEPVEAPTRVRQEPSGDVRLRGAAGPPPKRHHRSRFMRLLVPVTFICIAFGVIYGVKTFLLMDRGGNSPPLNLAGPGGVKSKVKVILEPEETSFESLTKTDGTPTLPVSAAPMPTIGGGGDVLPVEPPPVDGGIAALKMLEEFLAMKSLEERLPHIETKRPEQEIRSSVLNAPLPEVLKITVDVRETNNIEQMIDYYYHVDFAAEDGGENPQTMLVRTRGTSPPKVVVDPFLDLFGGGFQRYAEKPVKEAATFQVIISAGAFCYDDIPSPEKKYTLKILPRDDAREIAEAYFGKRSKIGAMLEDEGSGLAYGQAKACTIFMRWNMDEDPEKPFLEALDIKALDWNP